MGQQQLLLIVLGVIIVGIAITVGINLFTANAASANRDAVTADLISLASSSQIFYRRPVVLAGGGRTFTGWTIPPRLATNANGSYTVTVAAQSITLVGTGTENGNDGSTKVKVTMVVGPNSITSTTINN
jgi:hypothetical protein